jgi:RNA polymerase sigma-70 factor, ECF subfamily
VRATEPPGVQDRAPGVTGAGSRGGPRAQRSSAVADEELLRALWAEHGGPLLAYVTRLTAGDRGRAEDIVQETMLRAWRHPEALTSERGALRPWLCTVARHLAVDAHRARAARPHEVGDDALSLVPVADEAERVLESWLVADALRALSPEHRDVLIETYFRGRSVAEAAGVLGIPAGTVKSRTYYALRALKVVFAERGVTS